MTARRTFPLATATLVAVTVAAYAAELAGGGMAVCERFGFTPAHATFATALSSLLVHDPDHVAHVAGNMLVLSVLGSVVEPVLGHRRFLALFLAAGLGAAAMHWLVAPGSVIPLVGMSGSLCGLMAVGAVLKPRLLLAFVVSYIAINLLALYMTTPLVPPGTSVVCHIGGFTCGALLVLLRRARGAVGARWLPRKRLGGCAAVG